MQLNQGVSSQHTLSANAFARQWKSEVENQRIRVRKHNLK